MKACQEDKPKGRADVMGPIVRNILLVLLGLGLWAQAAGAQGLSIFEASVGPTPGLSRSLPAPANDVLIDIDYEPFTGEGGGFYGVSELRIVATGDVMLTNVGFACQTFGCLFSPSPFVSGQSLTLTGADDLGGEFGSATDLLTISVSGNEGHVILAGGEYLDATDPGMCVGTIRKLSPKTLVTVPEPDLALGLGIGSLVLMGAGRSRARRTASSDRTQHA